MLSTYVHQHIRVSGTVLKRIISVMLKNLRHARTVKFIAILLFSYLMFTEIILHKIDSPDKLLTSWLKSDERLLLCWLITLSTVRKFFFQQIFRPQTPVKISTPISAQIIFFRSESAILPHPIRQ